MGSGSTNFMKNGNGNNGLDDTNEFFNRDWKENEHNMSKMIRVGEQGKYVKGLILAAEGGVFSAPAEPGLYALYQEDGELIKIDAAINLQAVLREIKMSPNTPCPDLQQQTTYFCVEEVKLSHPQQYEPYLRAKKQELIERYQEDHDGEAPRYNKAAP